MSARHKYSAKKDKRDGITFDSKAEARYYDLLKARQEDGEIERFERQVRVPLTPKGSVKTVLDFKVWYPDGTWEYHEVKGFWTPVFRLKLALFEEFRGHETLRIIDAKDC